MSGDFRRLICSETDGSLIVRWWQACCSRLNIHAWEGGQGTMPKKDPYFLVSGNRLCNWLSEFLASTTPAPSMSSGIAFVGDGSASAAHCSLHQGENYPCWDLGSHISTTMKIDGAWESRCPKLVRCFFLLSKSRFTWRVLIFSGSTACTRTDLGRCDTREEAENKAKEARP